MSSMKEDVASERDDPPQNLENQSTPNVSVELIPCNTTTLFVGSLHPRIADPHLQKLFSPYGSIKRIHIVTHKRAAVLPNKNLVAKSKTPSKYAYDFQHSKGYAFVEYDNVDSARMAISRLDGRSLLGKNLVVRPARRQKLESLGVSETKVLTAEDAKKECKSIQSKIDLVKKALDDKTKRL